MHRFRNKFFLRLIIMAIELTIIPFLFLMAYLSRFVTRDIDIGLGPQPLINNVYHKRALTLKGYTAETFVYQTYFITNDFDIQADKKFWGIFLALIPLYLYFHVLTHYRAIYIYFTGGPLGVTFLCRFIEPILYKIAGIKVVVMPYGSDIQDMSKSDNLLFRHALTYDYPSRLKHDRRIIEQDIDRWIKHADHVISGCDWVYYMHYWDTLTLAHFSIDTDAIAPPKSGSAEQPNKTIKILHSPNHRKMKGTEFFIKAVDDLKAEGGDIELILVQKMPNEELKALMATVDIVADQLIIGWYAMTALEAMCMEKPVLCYLDPKLIALYEMAGLIEGEDDVPLVNCDFRSVKDKIRYLIDNPKERLEIGRKGRAFAIKHHSLQSIGNIFDEINHQISIEPQSKASRP